MVFTTKMQALINSHTNTDNASGQTALDWANDNFYQNGPGPGSFPTVSYLTEINFLTGVEENFADLTSYSPTAYNSNPIAVDPTGVYLAVPNTNLLKADKISLAQILNTNISFTIQNGCSATIRNTSGEDWLLLTDVGEVSSFSQVFLCVKASNFAAWTPGVINYNAWTAFNCSGPFGSGLGYMVAAYNNSDGGFQLIQVNVNAGSEGSTVIGSHPPNSIDPAFTQVVCVGMCLDQTDNNIIAMFTGTPSGAHSSYMIKINATTGAIMWNLGLPVASTFPQRQMAQSLIKSQQYGIIYSLGGGVSNAIIINTNSGTITQTVTTGLGGITLFSGQCFNDQLGAIVENFQLAPSVDGPALLNSTPATFTGWGVLYVVPGLAGSGGGGTNGGTTRSINSTVAAHQAFLQAINALAAENNCGSEYPSEIQYLTAFEEAKRWRAGRQ